MKPLTPILLLLVLGACDITDTKGAKTWSDLQAIHTALYLYAMKHGALPTTEQGLAVLPADFPRDPKDPWGQSYLYRAASKTEAIVYSGGPNRHDDQGGGDDIVEAVSYDPKAAASAP